MSAESPRPNREIAYRLFATEYDDATLSHAESDEERAPNYVITPTGARLNRLFVVGTLTEVSPVNDEMLRARVVDPTGAFVVYAGQYQPDELAALEQLDPPEFVAITGKARTFQPEDSERVYTSIRPESIATVDAETRDRWVASAAEQTIERIDTYAAAAGIDARGSRLRDALVEAGVDEPLAQGISLAQEHYGTTPTYLDGLRDRSLAALEVIAGDREDAVEFDDRPTETAPESRSFEEMAAAGTVDIDAADLDTLPADTANDDESIADEPAVSTAPAASGQESTDEVIGSASESEPETAPLSEESTLTDDEPTSAEPTDDTQADDGTADARTARDGSDDDTADSTPDAIEATAAAEDTTDSNETSAVAESPTSEDNPSGEQTAVESDVTPAIDEDTTGSESSGESSSTEIGTESDSDEEAADGDLGDFDSDGFDEGMYEMDDEEREELEAEFGTEFSTGAEVDDPGSTDIDVASEATEQAETDSASAEQPAGEESGRSDPAESLAEDDQTDANSQSGSTADTEPATESVDEAAEPDESIDVQAQVIETMNRLDDGDGADRSTVVSTVVDETGAAPDDVEDAIQDALMGGQCYEPDDETLKAI